MAIWWVFILLFGERLLELRLAARNRRRLLARGAREFHPKSYRLIVALHLTFYAALLIESHPWKVPLDNRTWICLIILALLQGLRYWCVKSLGVYWNTRIIVEPGVRVQRPGPYRFMRHPNYLVVVLEFIFLPLLLRAPVSLVVFSALNLLALRQRIRLEEQVLREHCDYNEAFPD